MPTLFLALRPRLDNLQSPRESYCQMKAMGKARQRRATGKARREGRERMRGLCHHIDSRVDTLVAYKLPGIRVTVEATSSDFALDGLPHLTFDRSARMCCYCCC